MVPLRSSFRLRNYSRLVSSAFALRVPPPTAPREAPTPVVLLSATQWDSDSSKGMNGLASFLIEKGFTCIETDLAIPKSSMTDSKIMMRDYESELMSIIRLSTIPFPPVIVARGSSCLIAQTYISSNPASGLVLISPLVSNDELFGTMLPTQLKEFNYEPKFPIAVLATLPEVKLLLDSNRICQDDSVNVISVDNLDEKQICFEVDNWLGELGL
ncbi:hypothetical protein BYT27DRAFT_7165368 [Phlegmacium glaucopus]|nr:hypothetical protein BYT27DRAFT_7165368 [Phlegmacium glaucopus]